MGYLHRNHCRQSFAQVLAGYGDLDVLEQVVGCGIGVHGPGQGGLETDQVGATLVGVDVVGKGEDLLVIGVVVLQGYFYINPSLFPLDEDWFGVETILVSIEVLDKGDDSSFVVEIMMLSIFPLIVDRDPYSGVEEGHFPEPLGKNIKGKLGRFEDFVVRKKGDLGATLLGFTDHSQGFLGHSRW